MPDFSQVLAEEKTDLILNHQKRSLESERPQIAIATQPAAAVPPTEKPERPLVGPTHSGFLSRRYFVFTVAGGAGTRVDAGFFAVL
jgi:hypothetical protein